MAKLHQVLAISSAALLLGAATSPQFVPLGKYDEGVMIPAASSLRFQRFDKFESAHFRGRTKIEGVFIIDCGDCEPGIRGKDLTLSVIPDASVAARLPRWRKHDNDIAIVILGADPLIRTLVTPAQRQALLAGRLDHLRGRTAIIVDRYVASLDCDSADYSARFVAVAKQTRLAGLQTNGNYGCGFN